MKKFIATFGKRKLNDRLRFLLSISIAILLLLALLISLVLTIRTSIRRSEEEADVQVDFMAASYDSWLSSVNNLMNTLNEQDATQDFCSFINIHNAEYDRLEDNLLSLLNNYKFIRSDMNFIAVINMYTGDYVYSGKSTAGTSAVWFDNSYEESIPSRTNANLSGSLQFNCGSEYSNNGSFTITFYRTVYSNSVIDKPLGITCVNIDDTLVMEMASSEDIEYCFTDAGGVVISTTSSERILGEDRVLDFQGESEGNLRENGKYYCYRQIPGWNFYVVSIIPLREIYLSGLGVAILMVILTIVLLLAALTVMRRIIDRSYEPLQQVLDAMDSVADNNLDLRIDTENMGEDFEKLGVGYNMMMDDIQLLMDQVLEEEKQSNQIRLNALQSQIQPHFLYNTLDTIHWQARMEGNREMSDLVMALAKYYRICLSKGKDVIPLSEELEQISCYLLIQNKRYGDIILYEMNVPEEFMDVQIPKLTLQPLVENSIYHGIRVKEGRSGTVSIDAARTDQGILISVADSGRGMTEEQIDEINASLDDYREDFGYGVRNVNRRIELMFGVAYGLYYRINESGGVTVEILLPEKYESSNDSIFGIEGAE